VVEKDQDLTTIFICFLKAGFRFTRNDTNIVGLRFAEELRKDNPDFKPVKIEQREFTKHFIVNGYPRAFEPVILDLVLEYGKKHKLEYRAKKSGQSGRRGGFRGGQNRQRGQSFYSSDRSGPARSFEGNRSGHHSGESHDARPFRSERSGEHRPRRRRIYRPGDGNQGKTGPGDNA
jgi:hypothetical protein